MHGECHLHWFWAYTDRLRHSKDFLDATADHYLATSYKSSILRGVVLFFPSSRSLTLPVVLPIFILISACDSPASIQPNSRPEGRQISISEGNLPQTPGQYPKRPDTILHSILKSCRNFL